MGSIITLGIGKLELDWGKNEFHRNHSELFQPSDKRIATYYYADDIKENKSAFVRPLKDTLLRLDLLGYSATKLTTHFADFVGDIPDYVDPLPFGYDDFSNLLRTVDVDSFELSECDTDYYDFGELVQNVFLNHRQAKELIGDSYAKDVGRLLTNFDPYVVLRLLAANPNNLAKEITWRYMDVVEAGYISEEHIYEPLPPEKKYLLVTEGSSDSYILKKAIALIFPEVEDFFSFIDMKENYPFTGTGNLLKFCQGLASMNVLNNVVAIFDNDAEGCEKYEHAKRLKRPSNLRIFKLPDLECFQSFPTVGPTGVSSQDINGKAVAIECFLDFKEHSFDPIIRWHSYNRALGIYQGSLQNKDDLSRNFIKRSTFSDYDFDKLNRLLSNLIGVCSN